MDPRDFFSRMFRFPNRQPPTSGCDGNDSRFGDDRRGDGFSFFFGESSGGLESMFDHFQTDMWTQMEALQRQMEDMMAGFGAVDFPSYQPFLGPDGHDSPRQDAKVFFWSNTPSPFFRRIGQTPRDFMLKDGSKPEDSLPAGSSPGGSKVDTITPGPRGNSDGKADTDLDGKISDDKILKMIIKQPDKEAETSVTPSQGTRYSEKSFSVSTTLGPNSKQKVEQKRIVKDESGQVESTVTRKLGDKSHTVTTVMGKDGIEQRHETFTNMDEKDLGKFEEEWTRSKQPKPVTPGESMLSREAPPSVDRHDVDIFSKLFDWHKR